MRWDKETSKVNPSADRKVMSIDPTTGKPAYVVLGEMQDYMSSLFKGVAQPTTVPQIIEKVKYAYFAFELGTYENFLGIDGLALEININEFGVFIWEGTYWTKHVVQVDLTDYMRISGLNSVIEQLNFDELKLIENSEEKTLAVLLPDGKQLLLNKALDDHYFNADIVQLVKGDVVSLVSGESKGVQLTDPNDPELAKSAIGIVIDETVPVGGKVLIRKIGVLGGLSALNYLAGQLTYVDPENPGKWTAIKPTTGTYIITACRIIDAESVDVQIAYQPMLGDLSDVGTINENIPIVKKGGIFKSEKTALDIESISPASGKLDVNGNLEVSEKTTTKNLEVSEDASITGDLNAGNMTSTGGFKKVDRTNSDLLLAGGGHLPILELKAGIYQLFNPTDNQEVVLEVNAAGQVIIRADIIHEGSQYETHAENINTPQSVITLRDGALSGLNLNELAGFVVRKYDGVNDGMIVIDKDGVLRIGDVGSLQPVLTREEAPVGYSPTFFNPATLRAETLPGTTTKNDLVDADAVMIKDSADSNKPKWWTWARIKANLKAYFDTLYIALTGNQVISGIKTFNSSPTVPTPTNPTDAANKQYVSDSVIDQMPAATKALLPALAYKTRIDTDLGSIFDLNKLTELYIKNLQLLDSTVFLWSGVSGMKTRTSGSNQFASKIYNMANKVQQFGAELVTNGTFTTNTSGWTGNASTITVDANRLKSVNTGTYGNVNQVISTVPGKTYHISFSFTYVDCPGLVVLLNVGGALTLSTGLTASTTRMYSFVATNTTTNIVLQNGATAPGFTTIWDNISVKQMDWVEGTNDAVQTTEANQPYVGGTIAPNEVGKIKHNGYNGTNVKKVATNLFTIAGNSPVTAIYVLKLNKGGTSVQLIDGTMVSSALRLGVSDSRLSSTSFLPTGTNVIVEFRSGGISNGVVKINGVKQPVTHNGTNSVTFSGISEDSTNPAYSFDGELIHKQIFNKALSESESQAVHDFLRLQIPEIEGIAIGNQYWATSNYEGVVAGDGSVIPEVQNSDNVEKISDVRDREFSEDTGWWTKQQPTNGIVEIVDGIARINSIDGSACFITKNNTLVVGKWYKYSFEIVGIPTGVGQFGDIGTVIGITSSTTGIKTGFFKADSPHITFKRAGICDFTIDNVSIEEVGWLQSIALYDAIYAQTSGTAAVKELAALKAASMWCYYSNNVNLGAIYGKLYNWYAVKLISLYPPQGYRVPTTADFTQLANYLGGAAVAGGKLKKEGLTYWLTPNLGATNESGFSSIGSGVRSDAGHGNKDSYFYMWGATEITSSSSLRHYLSYDNAEYKTIGTSKIFGCSIRLLRNSPVGPNETTVTTSTSIHALGAGNLDIVIPFGYAVDSIKVISKTGITGLSAKYCSRNSSTLAVTELDTLFTAKTVVADTPKLFNCNVDQTIQRQDAVVRINGTKADTAAEFEVRINIKKAIL